MAKRDVLKKRIERYLKKEQLLKNQSHTKWEASFLAKARKNIGVGRLLFAISEKEELKKAMGLASHFESFEWVIVMSYYAMYISALAALARLGFKSESHAATIAALEYYYVHEQKHLETKHLNLITKAYILSKDLVLKLIQTKIKRETAQYDATPTISSENARAALADAEEFVAKVEEVLGSTS